ncbi:response regulator receiver protein [Pseudomonas sp. L13]|nr:response regulator receiver protein [Pseudomonas sp. L13]
MYLHGSHQFGLVCLSIIIAVFSSCMALQTVHIARGSDLNLHRQIAIGTGSIALGGGIWTMHFIGMLSFELCATVRYDPALTMLSILPGWAASWIALQIISRTHVTKWQLVLGGILVGLGIGAMHYSGMAAMKMGPLLRYDLGMFSTSILVAIGLATLALWIRFGLYQTTLSPLSRLLISGGVMGFAISGMHYTGMAAARFIGVPEEAEKVILLDTTLVSFALSSFTITVTVLVTATNGLMRYRQLFLKMEESDSSIRAIVATAIDGIITINSHGIVQAFNQSAERLFGYLAHEVIGRNINMLMPYPDRSQHDSYITNYLTSGIPKIIGSGREVSGLRKDGSLMPMRLAVGKVDLPGEPLFVGFVTDITEHRELEFSLRETAARAEQAALAKTVFLANMSHEIRTPMNAIIGFTELLLKGDLTSLQRTHLNTVCQSSRSLLSLLNDILDTTKLEKGSVELEIIDFSLKELASQVVASLSLTASAKGLLLMSDYPDDMDEYFKGDPLRIRQVLVNLISNAIKFTVQGTVTLEFYPHYDKIHVLVKDTGIGMSSQQLESIFDPFIQADVSISRRFGGTGLGTTISRQLVELMGGNIQVDSELGKGSVFHIFLPLQKGSKPSEMHALDTTTSQLPALKILVADDVPQNVELVALTLQDRGHQVSVAKDGLEALEKFMLQRFDVVLMDVHMPLVDGLEATRRIRDYEHAHNLAPTPIIALTASVMESDKNAARAAGMNGFAVKPLEVARLLAEMARVLEINTSLPTSDNAETTNQQVLIDWHAGLRLWGDMSRLTRAIKSFLADVFTHHPLLGGTTEQIDWVAAAASLHGIRGAASNLALVRTAELAAKMEEQIREGRHVGINPLFESLRQTLVSVSNELSLTRPAASSPTFPSDTLSQTEVLAHIQLLVTCLERNELDDQSLQAVCAHLHASSEHTVANALFNAFDTFDFDRAKMQLQQLLHALSKEVK